MNIRTIQVSKAVEHIALNYGLVATATARGAEVNGIVAWSPGSGWNRAALTA